MAKRPLHDVAGEKPEGRAEGQRWDEKPGRAANAGATAQCGEQSGNAPKHLATVKLD